MLRTSFFLIVFQQLIDTILSIE